MVPAEDRKEQNNQEPPVEEEHKEESSGEAGEEKPTDKNQSKTEESQATGKESGESRQGASENQPDESSQGPDEVQEEKSQNITDSGESVSPPDEGGSSEGGGGGASSQLFNGNTLVDQTAHDIQDMKRAGQMAENFLNQVFPTADNKNAGQEGSASESSPESSSEDGSKSVSDGTSEGSSEKASGDIGSTSDKPISPSASEEGRADSPSGQSDKDKSAENASEKKDDKKSDQKSKQSGEDNANSQAGINTSEPGVGGSKGNAGINQQSSSNRNAGRGKRAGASTGTDSNNRQNTGAKGKAGQDVKDQRRQSDTARDAANRSGVQQIGPGNGKPSLGDKNGGFVPGNVSVGSQAAQDAKELAKAAGGLASGNGAAVLKSGMKLSQTAGKKLISIFIIGSLLYLCAVSVIFSYALPSSVFEHVETYTKEYYQEKYESAVYGSEGSITWAKFIEGIKIGFEAVGDAAGSAGSVFKSWINGIIGNENKDNQAGDIEVFSEDGKELKVAQLESAEKSTLKDKIAATQKKINARAETIADAIRDSEGGIQNAVQAYFDPEGTKYDEFHVNVSVTPYKVSDEGAAAIMGLYMVQAGGSLADVRLSSLLKWLGYSEGILPQKLEFKVFGVECNVPEWKGTFLPQYLYEQRIQEELEFDTAQTNFEDYQTAAADLILVADVPEMEEIVVFETVIENEDGSTKTVGTATVNIKVQPRNLEDIADLMGFWIGDLTKRQEYMISDLNVNMIATGGYAGSYGLGEYEWIEGGELPAYTPMHDLTQSYVGLPYQCTWYAADRMYQLVHETGGEYGADLTGLVLGNGGEWSRNARNYGYHVDNIAAVGKVACFVPGQTQHHPGDPWQSHPVYGHVAVVEVVNPDGSILVSEFWGTVSGVEGQVKFSTFTKETAATMDFIDFTIKS